ncbi:translation initiation factor IF-3 [Candidatus Ichthyocystis hellenicum]|uniref:translation initiation factor IF-3 n=1 Tax=Candidatus Ichthyocystis hellenicum TaxID=1561003 RepID=UPI000B23D656|nr:translation initiation factor IF-3 [Candidatus Ichthyocystis hellenicum]
MRINREITSDPVRVIGVDNGQLGVMTLSDALGAAEDEGVDLVEIVPQATPPVCRLVDYGKLKYQEAKKAHEAKVKQKVVQIKEVKFRPVTDEADYQVKLRSISRFLADGDKVKVTVRFRGREMARQDRGLSLVGRIKQDLGDLVIVEQTPKVDGRQMVMVLAPVRKK